MNRDPRLRVIDAVTRATLSVSSQFTALPTDFGAMINCELQVTPVLPMEYATPQQLDVIRNRTPTGNPAYFGIVNNDLEVAPVPASAVTLGLIYYRRIASLSAANTANWLLAVAPDLYLYAALIEASPYLHEDERVPVWESQYERRADAYRMSSERDQLPDAPLVMRGTVIG